MGENAHVPAADGPGVSEILDVLAAGAAVPLLLGLDVSQLDHALQTAARLVRARPGDQELAVAGLVHDLGHLLPGSTDETHAELAARAVAPALGERVARAVGLHVEAKRYLVTVEVGYGKLLRADSVASLTHQGGAMSPSEAETFFAGPGAPDAVELRRADDAAKDELIEVGTLDEWEPVLRRLARSPS